MTQLRNLKINKIAVVDSPATGEEFLIMKQNQNSGIPGKSEKDMIWDEIQGAFDIYQKEINDKGYYAAKAKGQEFTPKSREQYFAEWLKTTEGQRLYSEYDTASNTRTPVNAQDNNETKTLKDFGWNKLEKVVKKYQESNPGMSFEKATNVCARENQEYQEIYGLIYDSYPLDEVDFSKQISKSKSDAIALFKSKIMVVAKRAGV